MKSLSLCRLKELLSYDQNTGVFMWITFRKSPTKKNIVAGHRHTSGYWRIKIDGDVRLAHRLAWLYTYGQYPKNQIDHINGVRDDNRVSNLRDVVPSENAQNKRKATVSSATGFLGVTPNGQGFQAQIGLKGSNKYLGLFKTPELAHQAYLIAKRALHTGNTL